MATNDKYLRLAEITFPPFPDALTEEATEPDVYGRIWTNYGYWEPYAGVLSVDVVKKIMGIRSIKNSTVPQSPYHYMYFYILPDFRDLSKFTHLHFFHLTDENVDPATWVIELFDIDGNRVFMNFGTTPLSWEEKIFELKTFTSEPSNSGPFKWNQTVGMVFFNVNKRIGVESFTWLDGVYLFALVSEGTLMIGSVPTGKTGTFADPQGSYPFTTPSQVTRPVGMQCTVSIDPTDFQSWEDASINPKRNVMFEVGTRTITAYYTPAIPVTLAIYSKDQEENSFPGNRAVKLTYAGIDTYLAVPWSGRVSKGEYTLTAETLGDRTFDKWIKPDGTSTTSRSITINVQTNTEVTVYWTRGAPPPCFIATAAYGTPLAPQLTILRDFRDRYLPDFVVATYYFLSPPIAQLVRKWRHVRYLTRKIISLILKIVRGKG